MAGHVLLGMSGSSATRSCPWRPRMAWSAYAKLSWSIRSSRKSTPRLRRAESRKGLAHSFCLQDKWGATALHWAAASNLGAFPQSTRSSSKLSEAPRPYGEVPCAAPSWSTRPLWRLLGPQTAREFWPGLGGSRGGLQLQVREPDSAAGGRGAGQRALKWTLKVTFFKASVSPLFL